MSISGTIAYSLTANNIVTRAYQKIGVKAVEQPLTSNELTDGITALNLMIKSLSADVDLNIWMKREAVVFLDPGTYQYGLSLTTSDHACEFSDFVSTTVSSDTSSGTAVIPVASSTGMTAGDYVGIRVS